METSPHLRDPKSSRLCGKNYFLIYPTRIQAEEIRLVDIFKRTKHLEILHRENFTDVWVIFEEPLKTRNSHCLDVCGAHPCIKVVKKSIDASDYIEAYMRRENAQQPSKVEKEVPLPSIKLYPWQEQLEKEIEEPIDPRKIIWYFDREGNTGKSVFALWLRKMYPSNCLVLTALRSVGSLVGNVKSGIKRVFLLDLTKKETLKLNYSFLRTVKNGYLNYNGKIMEWDSPLLIVFSNLPPVVGMLSMDSWDIRELMKESDSAISEVRRDANEFVHQL